MSSQSLQPRRLTAINTKTAKNYTENCGFKGIPSESIHINPHHKLTESKHTPNMHIEQASSIKIDVCSQGGEKKGEIRSLCNEPVFHQTEKQINKVFV